MTGLNPSWYWPRHLIYGSCRVLHFGCALFGCLPLFSKPWPLHTKPPHTGFVGPWHGSSLFGCFFFGRMACVRNSHDLGAEVTNWLAALPIGVCQWQTGRPRLSPCMSWSFAAFNSGSLLLVLQSALCKSSSDPKQMQFKDMWRVVTDPAVRRARGLYSLQVMRGSSSFYCM